MNSKQALLKLCFKYLPTIDEMYLNLDEEDETLLNCIIKDLNALEILKKQFYFELKEYDWADLLSIVDKEDLKDGDGIDVTATTCLEKVDTPTVREWLNNEN